jgi:hypothetical protein
MPGIAGVLPHPVREGDVAPKQLLGVAPVAEPLPLWLLTDVEEADRDTDVLPAQLAPEMRSSTAFIIAPPATDLTPRAAPTP